MTSRSVTNTIGTLLIPPLLRRTQLEGKESYMIISGVCVACISNLLIAFAASNTQLLISQFETANETNS